MHHFGEDMTTGRIEGDQFIVEARHHTTGATVTMKGPTSGVFGDETTVVDQAFVKILAGRFAHFLRENLDSGPAITAASR
jgi:hypothetical protein